MDDWSPATKAIHADAAVDDATDVAPALHVSTTFRYTSDPDQLVPEADDKTPPRDPRHPAAASSHVYSRISAPNSTRLESILSSLLNGPSLAYASGLAAFHALLVHLRPRTVAIGQGYHGAHGVLRIYRKLTDCRIVDLHSPSSWGGLGTGDLVHLETPLNPSGEAYDVRHFAKLAHDKGALLSVDATFAPPPLLEPFRFGADYVLHSGTKYFGGHSDLLLGVLAVSPRLAATDSTTTALSQRCKEAYHELHAERGLLGGVPGNLESWLGARSLRTLSLRVQRQSASATELVRRLTRDESSAVRQTVTRVIHASLQPETEWLREQMPNGFPAVFSFCTATEDQARRLPSKLRLFQHATSLGGVESLIEWRAMSDDTIDRRLLRVSVGVEDVDDLFEDLKRGIEIVAKEKEEGKKSVDVVNGEKADPVAEEVEELLAEVQVRPVTDADGR